MAKKKYQYDALVQPILVEVSIVNNIPVFSASQVSISFLYRFQYQSRFDALQPIAAPAEVITLDKWFAAHGVPYRKKSNYYLVSPGATGPVLVEVIQEVITLDRWFQQTSTPVRKKVNRSLGGISFVETVSSENVKDIGITNSDIVRKKKIHPTSPSFFFVELLTVPDVVTLDRWQPNQTFPIRKAKRTNLDSGTVIPPPQFVEPENITLDKWQGNQEVPTRKKRTVFTDSTIAPFQPAPNVEVPLDRWFQNIVQPVRKPQRQLGSGIEPLQDTAPVTFIGVFSMGVNVITFNLKFQYQARFEPLRSIVSVEEVTLDKWLQNTNQPVQAKKKSTTAQTVEPILVPPPSLDTWFVSQSQPLQKAQRRQAFSGVVPIRVEVVEEVTVDKWLQNISQPLSRKKRMPHLYRVDIPEFASTNVVTIDRWLSLLFVPRRNKNQMYLYLTEAHNLDPILNFVGVNVSLGYNKNTNTGIGKKGREEIGRNKVTNTGVGKTNNPRLGVNKNTNTGIGKKLQKL